jgi:cyclomaltodextrin glucanotransferase
LSDGRGAVWYFAFTDRFAESDPGSQMGKDCDFDASRTRFSEWWGGDLAGVIARLDDLSRLGVGVLWLTPPFEQHRSEAVGGEIKANYHGYRPRSLSRLDPHLAETEGDLDLFPGPNVVSRLLDEAHRRNIKVLLDIDGFEHAEPSDGAQRDAESAAWCTFVRNSVTRWLALGFDGVRLGNLRDEPIWFWQELVAAVRSDRPDAIIVGEGPGDSDIDDFAREGALHMLDLGWRHALTGALAHRNPDGFRAIAQVAEDDPRVVDPALRVTMVDHLDYPRFLSLSNDSARYRLALLLTLAARGSPCLFYGNEANLHVDDHRGNDPYNRPWLGNAGWTPLADEIARIADLRARHPAMRKAGMRTKFLDGDRYAFTRCWHGDRVLVAVNRLDGPTGFGVIGLEFADGRYADLLGGADLEVDDEAARLTIPGRGIAIYVQGPAPDAEQDTVDVLVRGVHTAFGEQVLMVGDTESLGAWDVQKAIPLEYIDRGAWGGTIRPGADAVNYRYILRDASGVHREGALHERSRSDGPIWYDDWGTP